ncbi:replication initiation factor domain-containing protein, partial [Paraclostridium dentum]|uniref:replication initiation factor domain-containing protein n=1 Tax=Paraclostridium dentum TaxID=2662455 RepID=UPI003F33C2C9
MAEEKAKNRANDVVVADDSIQDFSRVGALINEFDFIAGYSNSQLKYQNLTLPLKFGWSIDRITIVGKLKDNILWDGRILVDFERLMRLNEDNGYLVALSPNSWKIIDKYKENIAYIEMSKFQKGYGRIDFNPNKVNEFISLGMKKFIHKLFLEPHFSRADVACDIVDVPDDFITQYRIIEAVGAKIFWGRDKKPETFYWGARSSERQVRLYNKKREQLKKRKIIPDEISSWWRFEAQLRQGKAS